MRLGDLHLELPARIVDPGRPRRERRILHLDLHRVADHLHLGRGKTVIAERRGEGVLQRRAGRRDALRRRRQRPRFVRLRGHLRELPLQGRQRFTQMRAAFLRRRPQHRPREHHGEHAAAPRDDVFFAPGALVPEAGPCLSEFSFHCPFLMVHLPVLLSIAPLSPLRARRFAKSASSLTSGLKVTSSRRS
ncbi:hypothetical protein LMG28614_07063 [Paraburkholderia ultramafica]|uniref:Uncharacterized protein n=1 Tax=Paraburkholderia ultramafica TaxID=1544867 RepID=A0A6S7BQL3_9BURK|nr:hypothetical protein LMG28614_07063 [Paraburkholderia ultramafica]